MHYSVKLKRKVLTNWPWKDLLTDAITYLFDFVNGLYNEIDYIKLT